MRGILKVTISIRKIIIKYVYYIMQQALANDLFTRACNA
jgi:hypothetical protein